MLTTLPLESDFFGFIAGLPVHPLVVHAAVVLLPLAALVLILLVFVPAWRTRFGWVDHRRSRRRHRGRVGREGVG